MRTFFFKLFWWTSVCLGIQSFTQKYPSLRPRGTFLQGRESTYRDFFATTTAGMERILAREVSKQESGSQDIRDVREGKCGVHFKGTVKGGLKILLHSRTALKLMEAVVEKTGVQNRNDLHAVVSEVDWLSHLDSRMTIKCDTTIGVCQDRDLRHTHFSSLTVKNAVVDQFRDAGIARPSVDTENPDMILHTYLHRGKCTLYKVWSGEDSMHKRGYRDTVHRAALRETTAAGLILISGWNGEQSALVDPMCGSGTLAIEAALIATNTAPGLLRYGLGIKGSQETEKSRPSVVDWPHMSSHEWEDLWDEAARMDLRKDIYTEKRPPKIFINDLHPGALELALRSARSAKVDHLLDFSNEEAIDYQPRCSEVGMIVTNPPWDIRLGNAHEAWSQLGDFARRTLGTDSGPDGGVQRKRNMWCLSGNPKVVRYMNLEDSDRVALSAGKIDLRFLKYSF